MSDRKSSISSEEIISNDSTLEPKQDKEDSETEKPDTFPENDNPECSVPEFDQPEAFESENNSNDSAQTREPAPSKNSDFKENDAVDDIDDVNDVDDAEDADDVDDDVESNADDKNVFEDAADDDQVPIVVLVPILSNFYSEQ
jgi:hypothetical protein